MIKLIIFDFDGTLADTQEIWLEVFNSLSKRYNLGQVKNSQLRKWKDKKAQQVLADMKIPRIKIPFFIKKAHDIVHGKIENAVPIKSLSNIVKKLSKTHTLAIITSNKAYKVEKFLKNNHFPKFKYIEGSVNLFGKTNKINRLLKKMNIPKQEAVYIGDETRDIEAAHKSKIKSIAVTWGFNSKSALKRANPTYLVSKPKQLLSILK